ncbi:MAG: error-prone DNA polymerase [Bdellovibrionales bacterium]|nr:error-prone DNA polymerase [Bdellovibrionales bacterium]
MNSYLERSYNEESPPLPFVELLGRSNFSFQQGASHPEEMLHQARTLGYTGFGLCDLNGLYGVVRAYRALHKPSQFSYEELSSLALPASRFRFHVGAEMQLADQSSVVLYPMSKQGYFHLCQLITLCKQSAPKSFSSLTLDDVLQHSEELVAFPLPPWNRLSLKQLKQSFQERLFLPVWRDYSWQSLQLYHDALKIEDELDIPLFATQRPFFHKKENKQIHDVFTCLLHGTTLKEAKSRLMTNSERVLHPLPQLWRIWKDRPDLLIKTVEISKLLQFQLSELHYSYPTIATPSGQSSFSYLKALVDKGLKTRFPNEVPQKVLQTVHHELQLIEELSYEDYFLTLYDICEFAKSHGILYQGRGSAANSVVCYLLGLTAVDPVKVDLLFERFLSKERNEPPDIDIDFESGRREEVIQYIYQKYGRTHAALTCTVITYRVKMALRDVGKVLGIPQEILSRLITFMGRDGIKRLRTHTETLQAFGLTSQQLELLLSLSQRLMGFPRHLGIHTGGFVLTRHPITECVPVENATMDLRTVIQWNKDDLETLKMMKVDILGLGMLTALQKSFALLKTHKNINLGLYSCPSDDPATYKMIQQADTIGVFQIESRAQMNLLPRLKPNCFYDLVIEIAIVRPGPIKGGMVHPFIRRRRGEESVQYAHPDLIPILKKTLGVPIFQEQIMKIASTVCGFTPGEADELRRIMSSGWLRPNQLEGLRKRIINGMLQHGLKMEYATQVFNTIVGFSSYGFPESHSASFALIAYCSCYLKKHHPEVFVCSLLNSQPMGFYSARALIADAERHKVSFLPLCIQKSDYEYTLEKPTHSDSFSVRVGFIAIHGLKKSPIERLLLERQRHGPFKDLADLIRRTSLSKTLVLSLGAIGAFHSMGFSVRSALWMIQSIDFDANSFLWGLPKDLLYTQNTETPSFTKNDFPHEIPWESLQREYHMQGFSLNAHPMSLIRKFLVKLSEGYLENRFIPFSNSEQLKSARPNTAVRIAGLLSIHQRPPTAKGFSFLTLEDEKGLFNVILSPKIYQQFRDIIAHNHFLEVRGKKEQYQGVINIRAIALVALPIEEWMSQKAPKTLSKKADTPHRYH